MPLLDLLSKIMNVDPSDGDMHLNQSMENWVANPYVVETSYSKEEDDWGNSEDEEDDFYDEEDDPDDEDNIDIGEAFTLGMTKSTPRLNHHIRFSSTSTSSTTPSIEDITHHGSSPPQVETIDQLIYDVNSPRPSSSFLKLELSLQCKLLYMLLLLFRGSLAQTFKQLYSPNSYKFYC